MTVGFVKKCCSYNILNVELTDLMCPYKYTTHRSHVILASRSSSLYILYYIWKAPLWDQQCFTPAAERAGWNNLWPMIGYVIRYKDDGAGRKRKSQISPFRGRVVKVHANILRELRFKLLYSGACQSRAVCLPQRPIWEGYIRRVSTTIDVTHVIFSCFISQNN